MGVDLLSALRAASSSGDGAKITLQFEPTAFLRLVEEQRQLAVIEAKPASLTWREKLWTAPPETRLTMKETCEALNMSEPTVRKHMTGEDALPFRRMPLGKNHQVVFLVGEVRDWLNRFEIR